GGDVPARAVLQALLAAGARLARPGEFTLRAFLNGRLDLVQAEAVAELIHARAAGGHARALRRLSGELSARLAALADALADAAAEVEARVDFAEDVGGVEVPPALPGRLAAIRDALAALARGAAWARRMREGVRVAIAGFPNAGKSSLFNRLVGEERAIVAARPGTTRDRVSETIVIAGARFTLSDTAGVRAGAGGAEREGVARALAELAASDLVLWVVDGSRPPAAGADAFAARLAGRDAVVALNKRDLGASPAAAAFTAARGLAAFEVSARTGEGVDALAAGLASAAGYAGELPRVNERQGEALAGAIAAVERARAAGVAGEPGEIVALELREALAHLAEVTGRGVGDDLLERIFSRFCVGK
ncbi:MAG TPA: GTPase, partial [Candidatus Eisenbacteria bacterium]|nr:GTPase [Candidatus Eisenbacteria bacterium]